jgi:hypothetical protein
MSQDLLGDSAFLNVLAGLPRVAELIATVPEERRLTALAAAEESYLRTARALGYEDADARQWATAVMSQLRVAIPLASEQP